MITKQCLIKILNEIQDYGKKLIDGSDGVVVANISNEMVADYLVGNLWQDTACRTQYGRPKRAKD